MFRLAWTEDRRVVRLRAPDGGLDTVLPDPQDGRRAKAGWQAKRHAGAIDWNDCVRSLDRAVRVWRVPTVTFVFPRDLTGREHATFHERVGGRHDDVVVDYWGASVLAARLATTEGKRIAEAYFEVADPFLLAERMLRAGATLETADDVLAAEDAIAGAVAAAETDYDWHVSRKPVGSADPAPTPGSLLRIAMTLEHTAVYADLVPRLGSPASMPGVTIVTDATPEGRRARRWIDDLIRGGGRLALQEGIEVRLTDVPPPFGDMAAAAEHREVTLRAVPDVRPYYARLTADDDGTLVSVDVDLRPTTPDPEWDVELFGARGGLTVKLQFVWLVHEARGRARLSFHYRATGAPHDVEAEVLGWLVAVHRSGEVAVFDRVGERPAMRQSGLEKPVPAWLELWARLHSDLAVLERAAGRAAPSVPDSVSPDEVRAIAEVAALLRARHHPGRLTEARVVLSGPGASRLDGVVTDGQVSATLVALVFGQQMPVARQTVDLPPMVIAERTATAEGWDIRLVPLSGQDVEVIAEIVPLADMPLGGDEPAR